MSYYILIILCSIVLIAYLFEVTGKFSKIPAVIFLMLLGIALKYLASYIGVEIPDLSILLPIMGTLGLILIVLEGSLDLKISKERKGLIIKSLSSAVVLFIVFVAALAAVLTTFYDITLKIAIINSIPIGIISSAVAIPSSSGLGSSEREFIVYESSISDILGILVFDFILYNQFSIAEGVLFFSFEVIASIIASVLISAALAYLLHKIKHHVKYVIILTVVVLIFVLAKLIHWPSLIVVLIFGLIMNNNHMFQTNYIKTHIDFSEFNHNLKAFKQITGELTFLVRSFFFLIFGFYTPVAELFNIRNLIISTAVTGFIFFSRAVFFKYILRKPTSPLGFFAPRGLITILLFLSIPANFKLSFVSEGIITQIIFLTIIVMSIGNMLFSRPVKLENKSRVIGG